MSQLACLGNLWRKSFQGSNDSKQQIALTTKFIGTPNSEMFERFFYKYLQYCYRGTKLKNFFK